MPYDPRYLQGVADFNAGRYFEAHEVWEELWHECPADQRRFVQGLIQLAVALYHHHKGNATSAKRQLDRGIAKLASYPPSYFGCAWPDLVHAVKATILHDSPERPEIVLLNEASLGDDG